MNHDDIDPSLRAAEPAPDSLDDGFSPPARDAAPLPPVPSEPVLGAKSPF